MRPPPQDLKPLEAKTDVRSIRLWLNSLLELCRSNRINVEGSTQLSADQTPQGVTLGALPCPGTWLKLTANTGGGQYSWTEVIDAPSGAWTLTANTGTNAWEINGNTTLVAPYYVRAVPGVTTGEWRFLAGPCP